MISDPAENERTVTRIMARLIDADKRIAEIKKLCCDGCDNCCGVKCLDCWVDDVMCLIDDAPSVDAVEVVHGHWIKEIDNSTHMHKCSVCGARVVKGLYEYDNPNIYCYHCGAKMDGNMENYRSEEVIR